MLEVSRILYVGHLNTDHWPTSLKELAVAETYEVECTDDIAHALGLHSQGRANLVILNDALLGKDVFAIIREIKRRSPLTPVMVLSEDLSTTYQTNLMMAGADDFVPEHAAKEELYYRLGFRLKQYRQSRDLALRNRNMYELTNLSRRLHSNVDPETLIAETIDQASGAFKLYGLAIILMEDDMLCIYAGQNGVVKNGTLYESKMYPQEHEPFYRVVMGGVSQVYDNITDDPNYIPIPALPDAKSAIIVPVRYQDYNMGAICAFGRAEAPLSLDDLALYEIFAAQFSVALQNAHYSHNQMMNVQFSRTLRRAWQRFVTLQSPNDIANDLHEMIKDLPGVQGGVVWLHDRDYWWMERPIVATENPKLVEIIESLIHNEHIYELIEQMDDGPQVLSQLGFGQKDPFMPLFRTMKSHQLVVLPIADSTRLIGGVIVSVTSNRQFSIDVVNLIKSLTHAAGQALERMTLILATLEKSGRLEAILLSITEGIFFVDDNGKVAFCNPQFTELTTVSPSEVLGRPPEILLDRIAEQSVDVQATRQQLKEALKSILQLSGADGDYQIVDVELNDPDHQIHIEFIVIDNLNSREKSWIGIVRDNSRLKSRTAPTMPYSSQIEAKPNENAVNPADLVLEMLDRRLPHKFKDRVKVKAADNLPFVEVDKEQVESEFIKSLQNAIRILPTNEDIVVQVNASPNEVRIGIHGQTLALPLSVSGAVYAVPLNQEPTDLVKTTTAHSTPPPPAYPVYGGNGLDKAVPEFRPLEHAGAPLRAPQTIMIIEGSSSLSALVRSQMMGQGYDILSYRLGEEALRDINLTRIDLIIIDTKLSDMNGLDVCEYMRKHTETPIIMIADTASDTEKVRALNLGADDYITRPISDEELLARIQVIFKRQQLPDRTRKPLDLGDLVIDFARREVFVNKKRIELTRIEYDLLHSLVVNQGQVLTHQQILEKVWGPEYRSETQYLWVNICRLRKKLEPTKYIQNRQGVGYVFQPN